MKKILIIDDSDLFREFLSQKLTGFGFEVMQAINGFDGIIKMRQADHDLVIMDYYLSRNSSLDVLKKKNDNPNAKHIPVIMASAKVDRENLLLLSQYGVKKFFTKPIKIDAMVKAIAELLKVNIEVDNTPCIIDANLNDEIIFVEVARGLNRDKIELLKFRLQELVALYKVPEAKVLVMMSGLDVGPNDSLQLASLISTIADYSGARTRNIKILTSSEFVRTFIRSRPNYNGIEVVDNLEMAMDGLMANKVDLNMAPTISKSGLNMQFEGETKMADDDLANLRDLGNSIRIAVVDDDFVLREIIKKAFTNTFITIDTFADGSEFIASDNLKEFDLVFLDLMMPVMDGFQVMTRLNAMDFGVPVIVLSALTKRETVVKAMGLGVKSYMIKPIQPEGIRKKAIEILRMNF